RNQTEATLCVAFELSEKTWKLGFTTGHGQKPRERTVTARQQEHVLNEIAQAKRRFGLPETASVVSCVTVQVVQTGITPQLVTSDRLQEAKTELLRPVKRLHTQWSGTPRRSAAVASTWPRPSSCFRQSASPPRSACQSSPYARAHRDGSTSQPYYSS